MPTRTDVQHWNTPALTAWSAELDTAADDFDTQLARMVTHFQDTAWEGAAHDAACVRITEENSEGCKLGSEIHTLAAALRSADQRLSGERNSLLGKVADAEADTESPLALQVTDAWVVETKLAVLIGIDITKDDLRKVNDRIDHHQGLINTAYYSLTAAVSETTTDITTAAETIRARGDLLGRGIGAADAAVTDAASLGREDGQAVHDAVHPDGSIDQARLDDIARHLPGGILTEQQLHELAGGNDVATVPAATQQYYRDFFHAAGKDGLVALTDHLTAAQKAGDPVAGDRLTMMANGFLAISNETVGTGRDTAGKLVNPGGYQQLPTDLRALLDRRWEDLNPAVIIKPGQQATDMHQLMSISELVTQASPGNQPGTSLGVELSRQAASMAQYLEHTSLVAAPHTFRGEGWRPDDWQRMDAASHSLFNVGTSNHEAAAALVIGRLPEEVAVGHDRDTKENAGFNRDQFASLILHHDWGDRGATAARLFSWVGDDAHDTHPDGTPTARAITAREALTNLPGLFAPTENPAPAGQEAQLHRPGGLATVANSPTTLFEDNASVFARNPDLANAMANVLGTNINAFREDTFTFSGLTDDETKQPRLAVTDANRLLFLGSQSDQGRMTLEVARQAYESAILQDAFTSHGTNAGLAAKESLDTLASLDGRITNAAENAMTFQDQQHIKPHVDHQIAIYNAKHDAAKAVADIALGMVKVPGAGMAANAANHAIKAITDEGVNDSIKHFLPEPVLPRPQFPDITALNAQYQVDMETRILNAAIDSGQDVSELRNTGLIDPTTGHAIDLGRAADSQYSAWNDFRTRYNFTDFMSQYKSQRSIESLQGMGEGTSALSVLLTGMEPQGRIPKDN